MKKIIITILAFLILIPSLGFTQQISGNRFQKVEPKIPGQLQLKPNFCSIDNFSIVKLNLHQKITLYGYEFHYYAVGHNEAANISYTPTSSDPMASTGAIMFHEPNTICESITSNVEILLLERKANTVTLLIGILPDWVCQ